MIGRKREIDQLNSLYYSNKAELVVVSGGKGIGKTYLIDETFKGRITFRHAGLSPVEGNQAKKGFLKQQLQHFYFSLLGQGMPRSKQPSNWLEAFYLLETFLQSKDDGSRQVIFLDELPWLDTPRSNFITAFEAFWNSWACHRSNIMVIVCGSANSWIQNKLINNHGGLYNRVTYEIKLSPFCLAECKDFFSSNHIELSEYDIAQSYMILGGVPYYLGYFERGKSLAQNIDQLFFEKNARLKGEFNRLFSSVFTNPETMMAIVSLLSKKSIGMTRKEISDTLKIKDGGNLSSYLNALISSDFIIKYIPFGEGKRDEHYKLIDPFCIFYLRFIASNKNTSESFWQENVVSQSISIWRGYAFENLCFNHIQQIKSTLGILGVSTAESSWIRQSDDHSGSQIDMIIERKDGIVNLCEMKFYSDEFKVDQDYYRIMLRKQENVLKTVSAKQSVNNTLISTYGIKYNEYSSVFANIITLHDLFRWI